MRIGTRDSAWLIGGLFSIFLLVLPLERIGSLDVAGFTLRVSQVCIVLLFGFIFLEIIARYRRSVIFAPPLFLYVLYLAFSLFSFWDTFDIKRSLLIFILHLFMLVVAVVIAQVITKKEQLERYIQLFMLVSIVIAGLGLLQFVGDMIGLPQSITGLSDRYVKSVIGIPRIQATFIEPLYFANYLLMPLSLSVAMFFTKNNQKEKRNYFILALLFSIVLLLTVSKGGIAAAGCAILVILLIMFRRLVTLKNIMYGIVIVAIGGLMTWSALAITNRQADMSTYIAKAQEVVFGGGSVFERQEAYRLAVEAYQSSPIYGIGLGSFGGYFSGYQIGSPDYGWPIVNNQYLEVLAETGIVGFVSFVVFIISIAVYAYWAILRMNDPAGIGITTGLLAAYIGTLVQYMTFSTLYIMHIWVLIGMLMTASALYAPSIKKDTHVF